MPADKGSDTQDTVAHFDDIAERYHALYAENTPVGYSFTVRRQRVLDLFDADGGRVLDVGCGPGVMGNALLDRDCELWGVDPSVRMVEAAAAAFSSRPKAHFLVGSAYHLGFPDDLFDTVICMGVLERIRDDEAALGEMARVLKPGGRLIVTVPNRRSPALLWRNNVFYAAVALLRPLHRRLTGTDRGTVIRGHRLYARRSFAASIADHGCDVTDVAYCAYNLIPAPLDSLAPAVAAALMRRVENVRSGRLRTLGAAMIMKATKRAAPGG